ncbi:MAG: hypothetical protein AAF519_15190 [Bacteroidota bacterium]
MRILFTGLVFLSFTIQAQNPLDKRIKPVVTCFDITYNALELIPQYHQRRDLDSVLIFINYWEKKCGISEYSQRARTLFEIERNVFDQTKIDDDFFENLTLFVNYTSWKTNIDTSSYNPFQHYRHIFENPNLVLSFDTYTSLWARDLLFGRIDLCDEEYRILTLYAEKIDAFFARLNKDNCPESKLGRIYRMELNQLKKLPDYDWGLIAGYWMPQGNASLLGNHPTLGLYGGLQKGRWLFDFTILFRFLEADNDYFVVEDGIEYETDHFFGGYIGADIGYQLVKRDKSRLYALSGVGFDGFDALGGGDEDDPSKSINSLNLNLGLGFRQFFSHNLYIGIEARQNFVDYNNRGGTDLSGNSQSIRLLFGFMQNFNKEERLKTLREN